MRLLNGQVQTPTGREPGKGLGLALQGRPVLSFPVLILEDERQDAVGAVMDPALAEARPGQDRSPPIRLVAGETRPLVGRA